jgi:hypothetical protein
MSRRALVLVVFALAVHVSAATDCKSLLEIFPRTCNDVSLLCATSSCDNTTGIFSCSSPVQCSGALFTTPSFERLPRCPSNLNLTAFEGCRTATEALADIGCTCSSCAFIGDEAEVRCSEPFLCSETVMTKALAVDYVSFVTDKVEYGTVWGVYCVVAAALWFGAKAYRRYVIPPYPESPLKFQGSWLRKRKLDIVRMTVAPYIREDGSFRGFICSYPLAVSSFLQLWVLVYFLVCKRQVVPPPHQLSIVVAAVLAGIVSTFAVPASFILLLGNIKFDHTCIVYARAYVKCNRATMNYGGYSTACDYGSIDYNSSAHLTMVILGFIVNCGMSSVSTAAPCGCKQQIVPIATGIVASGALFLFAWFFSDHLARAEGAQSSLNQRPDLFKAYTIIAWMLGAVGHVGTLVVFFFITRHVDKDFIPHLLEENDRLEWCSCRAKEDRKRVAPSAVIDANAAPPIKLHAIDAAVLETETGETNRE